MEVSLKNITKSNDEGQVLFKDYSVTIASNTLTTIAGDCKSGKSTFLKLISGDTHAQSGKIQLTGNVNTIPSYYLSPRMRLQHWRSVLDNVSLPIEEQGRTLFEAHKAAQPFLKFVDLYRWQDVPVAEMTEEDFIRIEMARALISRAKILLFDNLLHNTKSESRSKLQDLVLNISRQTGRTIIFATDDPAEAVYLGQRVLILKQGTVNPVSDHVVPLPTARYQLLRQENYYQDAVEKVDAAMH
ncbi:MAG: ATP-binding cassette domain-containing protein [Lentisphaeria bacterium]|nr:ATP-binding cassette domain-containing protein [Lentisphaeria bacterium]